MKQNHETELPRRRRKPAKPYPAVVAGNYAMQKYVVKEGNAEFDDGEFFLPDYYLQIASTLGLKRQYDHPEVEAFISFRMDNLGYSVLTEIVNLIRNGARFREGDQIQICSNRFLQKTRTVEFRSSKNVYGPCLRAVVMGIEEEFQSLPHPEAERFLQEYGPLYDPFEHL